MGKDKSNKKNDPQATPQHPRRFAPFIFAVAIIAVLGTVYYATKPSQPNASRVAAPATGRLEETRPVLTPALFTGKAAMAYEYAAKIPKVIDSLFCYCYCKKNHGHKTLLTCFTNEHGSKCDVCIGEVLLAYELYQDGKTIDEIVAAVDKKFYKPYESHGI